MRKEVAKGSVAMWPTSLERLSRREIEMDGIECAWICVHGVVNVVKRRRQREKEGEGKKREKEKKKES